MQKCKVCGSTEFDKADGYFFCKTCQTQNEDIREEILELRLDPNVRLRKQRVRSSKPTHSNENLGWTTWELYNFVLIGLTDELIGLGVTQDIKLTVLQLWATYLRKLEVAFISTTRKHIPKLARQFKKRDAEIIYGKLKLQKKIRKRKRGQSSTNTSIASAHYSDGSSQHALRNTKRRLIAADYERYIQSQASSEGDAVSSFSQSLYSGKSSSDQSSGSEGTVKLNREARLEAQKVKKLSTKVRKGEKLRYRQKHVSTVYRMGPQTLTPMKLWVLIYLALRIHNEPVHIGDMLRYGREGHLSYYKLDHLLPPEMIVTQNEINFLTQNIELTHKGIRRSAASMAKFLGVYGLICPDIPSLVTRYCQELELPRGVSLYAERFIALSPPIMDFNKKTPCIPNYEGRAMAFIIVVLKILFSLDGITEYEISKIAETINSIASKRGVLDSKLFSFREWQRFIECRKATLAHIHFPTKLKYQQEIPGDCDLYIKFLESMHAKNGNREQPELLSCKYLLPKDLLDAMTQCIANLKYDSQPLNDVDMFAPSLTPFYSYIRQKKQDPLNTLPPILETDFFLTKIGYITKVEHLQQLAAQCDIHLELIESSLHFMEKVVPQFENVRITSVEELKEEVDIYDDVKEKTEPVKTEDFNEYIHGKIPCKIKINLLKELYYSDTRKVTIDDCKRDNDNFFEFNATTSSGTLLIPGESDSESENDAGHVNDSLCKDTTLLVKRLCEKHGIQLSTCEKDFIQTTEQADKESVKNVCNLKAKLNRDSKGRFIRRRHSKRNANISRLSPPDVIDNDQDPLDAFKNQPNLLSAANEILMSSRKSEDFSMDEKNFFNLSSISILDNTDACNEILDTLLKDMKPYETSHESVYRFFRPFKDYWAYQCLFSRVSPKNFELLEKDLPISFRWLLNECAGVTEMPVYDLYEEVCLIESYHAHVFQPENSNVVNKNVTNPNAAVNRGLILSKW